MNYKAAIRQRQLQVEEEFWEEVRKMNDNSTTELVNGAATSTRIPNFGLIPRAALVAYANRLEKGIERHGDKAWNAQSANFKEVNRDKAWVLYRLSHVIDHALQAIAEITGQVPPSGEDHAGALLFGGGVLACSDWNPYLPKKDQNHD